MRLIFSNRATQRKNREKIIDEVQSDDLLVGSAATVAYFVGNVLAVC